jgi:hypothetical protein
MKQMSALISAMGPRGAGKRAGHGDAHLLEKYRNEGRSVRVQAFENPQ